MGAITLGGLSARAAPISAWRAQLSSLYCCLKEVVLLAARFFLNKLQFSCDVAYCLTSRMACARILLNWHLLCTCGYTARSLLPYRIVSVYMRTLHVVQNELGRIGCEGAFHGRQSGQYCLLVLRAEFPRVQLDVVASAARWWLGAVNREFYRVLGMESVLEANAVLACDWSLVSYVCPPTRRAAIMGWWLCSSLFLCRRLISLIMRSGRSLLLSWRCWSRLCHWTRPRG